MIHSAFVRFIASGANFDLWLLLRRLLTKGIAHAYHCATFPTKDKCLAETAMFCDFDEALDNCFFDMSMLTLSKILACDDSLMEVNASCSGLGQVACNTNAGTCCCSVYFYRIIP